MCKEIVLYNDDPNDKTDRACLFNDRGNRLAFIDEQHAIYFIEVEHPEIIEKGFYKNYFIRDYLTGDDELGRPWNGFFDKEV